MIDKRFRTYTFPMPKLDTGSLKTIVKMPPIYMLTICCLEFENGYYWLTQPFMKLSFTKNVGFEAHETFYTYADAERWSKAKGYL